MKEINVIGTMQLLAACQKAPTRAAARGEVHHGGLRLRARATRPCSPRTRAAKALPRRGYAKDAVEVEGYVRGFARRRPDVAVTVLRFANIIGPRIDTRCRATSRCRWCPTVLGYDARLQLVHEEDALEVLRPRGEDRSRHVQRRPATAC